MIIFMDAYETPGIVGEKQSFLDTLAGIPRSIDERLPTMDKGLDQYFDQNLPAIIEEWGLVTSVHFAALERRLSRVSGQIDSLERGRKNLEKRAGALEDEIKKLEGA